jgi:hypothetical protein
MPVGLRVSIKGIDEWKAFLKSIPYGVKGVAMRAFAEYVMGDSRHGLKHPAAYRYVSRKSAYGRTFFSDAQRRWFFANGAKVGNFRTGRLMKAWSIGGSAQTRLYLINSAPYAGFVIGSGQARQPAKVGWRPAIEVVMSNFRGGIAAAQRAVNAWLGAK